MAKKNAQKIPDRKRSVELIRPEIVEKGLTSTEAMGLSEKDIEAYVSKRDSIDSPEPPLQNEVDNKPIIENNKADEVNEAPSSAEENNVIEKPFLDVTAVFDIKEETRRIVDQIYSDRRNPVPFALSNDLFLDYKVCLEHCQGEKKMSEKAILENLIKDFVRKIKPSVSNFDTLKYSLATKLLQKSLRKTKKEKS